MSGWWRDGLCQSLQRGVCDETAACQINVSQPPVVTTTGQQTGGRGWGHYLESHSTLQYVCSARHIGKNQVTW